MIDAELIEHGRVEVVDFDWILEDVVRVVVGLAVGDTGLDATAREPDGEATRMVIAAVVFPSQRALALDGAAAFAIP